MTRINRTGFVKSRQTIKGESQWSTLDKQLKENPRINSRQTIKGEVLRWNINEYRKQLGKGGNVRSRQNAVRREHCSRFCRRTRRSSCGQELRLTQGAIKIWDFEQNNPIFHRSKRKFLITGVLPSFLELSRIFKKFPNRQISRPVFPKDFPCLPTMQQIKMDN